MIAFIKHVAEWVGGTVTFAVAVWHDARSLQAEAEAKYGPIGY